MTWADSKHSDKLFFYDSAFEYLNWKNQHDACLTLFPLSIHYAIKWRFADSVNEANCIPARVSHLGKQTSASQLKGKIGELRKIFKLFMS